MNISIVHFGVFMLFVLMGNLKNNFNILSIIWSNFLFLIKTPCTNIHVNLNV